MEMIKESHLMALTGLTFCKFCKKQFNTEEELKNHCFTVEHRKLIFEDSSSQWKHRDPAQSYKDLKLCERSQTCEYGDNCLKAHSKEELREWKRRIKDAQKRTLDAADQGLLSYQDRLLDEYRHNKEKEKIVSDITDTPDVKVTCDTDSDCVYVRQIGISSTWNFTVTSKEHLKVIALLRQDTGATFTLSKDPHTKQTFSTGEWFLTSEPGDNPKVYEITVSFTSDQPGLYEQWLIFDFNTRPVLRQKLRVNVGLSGEEISRLTPAPEVLQEPSEPPIDRIIEPWNEENVTIVPLYERSDAEKVLLNKYKLFVKPQMNRTITCESYKENMHMFLFQEEKEEVQLLARLNMQGSVQLTNKLSDLWFGLKLALPGELFAVVNQSHPLTPNTPQGYIMKRHIIKALVHVVNSDAPVYEAALLKDTLNETHVHLQLSKQCCTDYNLEISQNCEMEVQFHLNRQWFCDMHKAVDDLRDLDKVLPDLKNRTIHISCQSDTGNLNEQQKAAMNFFLSATDNMGSVPPLLIYGPFGTGKTLTLAKMARILAQQPQNKILICTHTNSSADLYVEKHFHKYVPDHPEVRPLRIKAMEKSQQSTDYITLQYCHLSKDGRSFEFPDKAVLDSTRIIITTTTMARYFQDMNLPENYFSHILIDEASQMLECEALMALGLAGKKTHVVLAGDHMQMGPKLFSVTQEKSSDHTLLNRLFYHYQAENSITAKQSRIIFSENYRSTKDIVDFVSEHFYERSNQRDARVIKARGNVPSHPEQHTLQFHHVRGECLFDSTSMSWFNAEEIKSVVGIVEEIKKNWPTEWCDQDPTSICVLSQGRQVNEIRKRLRNVTVENAENVQGKQFRVIVISTVHTKDSLLETNLSCLEFFNDRRVLNTVMTRAQSQIVVVGDAAALAHFGTCCRLWMSYIEQCISKGSAYHLVGSFWKQDLLELSKLCKSEDEDCSDSESTTSEISNIDDPILKELLDNEDINIPLTDEGLFPVLQNELVRNVKQIQERDSRLPQINSSVHKCELSMKSFWQGYARSLDDPTVIISIKGRRNMGHSFPGDKVEVEIINHKSNPPMGKVIQVLESADTLKEFLCTIEKHDSQVMRPINNCICKIFTPFWKDKPKHIAVRSPDGLTIQKFIKINEESHRNYLFVVRILNWRKNSVFPLGTVVGLFPKIESLKDGLKVLDIEYKLRRALPSAVEREMQDFQDLQVFETGRKDFKNLQTFTIDSEVSEDLDDAISVMDLGEHYEIGVHISDVASYVCKDSELDKYARQQCTAFYSPEREPTYMFPKKLSVEFFSLIPNCDRRAISLILEVDKKTYCIKKRYFFKSVICSKRRFSYDEVENILTKKDHFDPLDACLVIACNFAEVHRKFRKQEDWCYKAPNEDVPLGRRRSHIMIEELMIMFNHTVADRLLFDPTTRSMTPLRCQDMPRCAEIEDFFDNHASLVPLSAHLSCQADSRKPNSLTMGSQMIGSSPSPEVAVSETFPILVSLLECLKKAAQDKDIYRIIDYITTDDIYPQLLPVAIAFRNLFQRAYFLRSNSTHASRIGHCDLDLDSYTWASSPIRRYIDVLVQRLLHSVIDTTVVSYTLNDINLSCLEFSRKNCNQSEYDKKVHSLHFASKLSIQNERKVAYIVELIPSGTNFRVSFPLNRDSMPAKTDIMYRNLQLADQPQFIETNCSIILKWVRRIYSFSNPDIHAEIKQQKPNKVMAYVSTEDWKCLVAAIKVENWQLMFFLIEKLVPRFPRRLTQGQNSGAEKSDPIQGHYVELSLELKQGDVVQVQLGTSTFRGLPTPTVQLFVVHPKFEICLEHVKDPIKCFSKYASHSSRILYNTYMDYQATWNPMCEMESVTSAVAENESIVLEDVPLEWETCQPEKLQGFFLLPLNKKAQWSIESDLKKCYLCIRSRIHRSQWSPYLENSQCADLMNIQTIIWVAHGVITNTEVKKSKLSENVQIYFRINHMPMTRIPDVIFSDSTRFTVELIPKLLPDVRKENALDSLTKANQLVKNIAMGRRIYSESECKFSKGITTRFEINKYMPTNFFLNESQHTAIRKALVNPFTIIQGPPGTGKTVVGVHIVYWLLKKIQKLPASIAQKKRAILYCGPSNKSVDVVAGHLLKLQKELRPLRIYSDQMEMLEFPYPGCSLKLARHSKRVEKPNTELSSIALHHLIRKDGNPCSAQIQAFDMKIQREDQLTKEEMKCYKEALQKARKHELLQHDVILCTCTAASQPTLAEALDIKQIIIDECAMATEPEAFIPLVAHKPEQIVLLGDHMQLQPIVHCDVAARLGMDKSLFERYMANTSNASNTSMLDVQYRMQEVICAFPSLNFYDGKLKTYKPHKPGLFLNEFQSQTAIIFGHVEGKEKSLVVSTEQGNENSKANEEEAKETVRIARLLTRAGIQPHDIAILTPYNAQVANISARLRLEGMYDVTVNTIMKSQGSEWKYVILSTVRSCPEADIEPQSTKSWITTHLGFVMDPHQVNVAITRAQDGLCIIGNEHLLRCSYLWRNLLDHYQKKRCVLNPASRIQVQKPYTMTSGPRRNYKR